MITFKHVLFCTSTCTALVASISRNGFVVKHRQGRQLPPPVGDAAASLLSSSMTPSLVTMPVAVATYESSATMSEPSVVSASETALFNASSTTSLTSFASLTTSSAASTRTGSSHSTTAFVNATNAGNVTDTAATAPPDGDLDLTVLNLAFVLENLEASFYSQALQRFSLEVIIQAGLSPIHAAIVIEQITVIQADEQSHVSLLAETIVALGGEPFTGCGFAFDSALADPATFLGTARTLEAVGVSAYLGAANLISDPSLLTAAASIVTLEARHQSLLNVLNGGSYSAQAFDLALPPQAVLSLASGFLTGCQPTNAALTVVNEATGQNAYTAGSKLGFSMRAEADMSALTCQMLIGGEAVALTLPADNCTVPAGVDGPVAVYLTNASTPLAVNVIIQAQTTIVAGPGFIFVDSQVSILASVLSPFFKQAAQSPEGGRAFEVASPVNVEPSSAAVGAATEVTTELASAARTSASTELAASTASVDTGASSSSSSMVTVADSAADMASAAPYKMVKRHLRRERRGTNRLRARDPLPTIQESLRQKAS
ncbi:hypothetical protein Rhopal_005908-T1 [Rhodotorula paludigena]|uniref:Ferritin-like domain-containing protein n=1 Tax=Rhodotorula paludigena TaxID=86838 RepID=A0AAV5GRM8_9BASI|nr:hypothetical protein Rhopal_005908-T1 [Rhodotorula paludigena]